MIILNGKAFAESDSEFTDSLFNPINGHTCTGYDKRLKRQIKLLDHQKNLIGVINKYGALVKATKRPKGYWYSYGDIDQIGRYESVVKLSNDIGSLAVDREYQGFEAVYRYK